jgi:hypothetical protein
MGGYIVSGAAHIMSELKLPADHYILNVTYRMLEGKANCTGDTQLFMTGTVAAQEAPELTCVRELQEELMMRPKQLRHLHHHIETRGRSTREVDWYECRMADLEFAAAPAEAPLGALRRDGKNKISCILHGTYEEAITLLKQMPVMETTTDEIVGVVCLRVGDVQEIIKTVQDHYTKFDHFFWCSSRSALKEIYAFSGRMIPSGASKDIYKFSSTMDLGAWSRIRKWPTVRHDEMPAIEQGVAALELTDHRSHPPQANAAPVS